MRTFDSMLIALGLITPIFLGSVLLLIDIPIFNRVNPLSLELAYLGLGLGLTFGLIAGRWYTKEQLKFLTINHEFKGLGSKKINVAVVVGLAIFLVFSFFIFYFKTSALSYALANSVILFVPLATFTLCIIRIVMINSWEKHEKKVVMQEWNKNKFYYIPYPPQFYDRQTPEPQHS
jgi:hypothetical protein